MKLGFDMDGTICDGGLLVRPINTDDYKKLPPFDEHTRDVWNKITAEHDVYIITSRSYPGSRLALYKWLQARCFNQPAGICTFDRFGLHPGYAGYDSVAWKVALATALNVKAFFDDSPEVYKHLACCHLMDNRSWPENQECIPELGRLCSWMHIKEIVEELELEALATR